MAISLSSFKTCVLSLSLLSSFLFFLLTTPTPDAPNYPSPAPITPHRSLITTAAKIPPCSSTGHSNGLFNYLYLHFCLFRQNPLLSLSSLSLILLLLFYILIKTAQDHFSLVTTKARLFPRFDPQHGHLRNWVRRNSVRRHVRVGVRSGVCGDLRRAFSLNPAPFVRDVLFYLTAALFLFYVYLSAEIYLWQAVGFVGFYLFFVGLVFWMDFGLGGGGKKSRVEVGLVGDCEMQKGLVMFPRVQRMGSVVSGFGELLEWYILLISQYCSLPSSTSICLQFVHTIPSSCCFSPFRHPFASMVCNPLGNLLSCTSSLCKLLNYLAALETLLELPPALLGLTVLAWGNSVGDLVADVAVAKAGHPAMAMAGCFAGPMFNMLVGLGTALVIQTYDVYPEAYELQFHVGIVIAFVFLLLSLMGSLLVITWCRFRVPRFWGFCLVGLYVIFMAVSLVIAKFSG
ncbi:cation/calcium exchanger 5-like [Pyrus ussuriensis x Pyrus communis]|uniref:Cation/calcium exchanger 5-like n=1 Tax=Pyrus ussuriensis x Pyrus communis TaxID=2448454 RepID=A0A5N5I3H1_9ROSA|nr:cation/calcium exchanger 5-like [Pyrus ussuriensis x Pyrus communis]